MTTHSVITANSNNMSQLENGSINLIVTSPPYPMIEMWDEMFSEQDPSIKTCLAEGDGLSAYNKMHDILNSVWKECDRVLKDNGFVVPNPKNGSKTVSPSAEYIFTRRYGISSGKEALRSLPFAVIFID